MTIAADPKRLGARVGMTSVLHTWGSALTHHPHIHMIVPGRRPVARWHSVGRLQTGLLPACAGVVAVVPTPVYRRADGAASGSGELAFFGDLKGWLDAVPLQTGWPRSAKSNGWSMPNRPSADPKRCWPTSADTPTGWRSRTSASSVPVPTPCRSDGRTTASRRGDRMKVMRLDTHEFIRRFLMHVLPDGFHRIRHYGLLASAQRKVNIAKVRVLIGASAPEQAPSVRG